MLPVRCFAVAHSLTGQNSKNTLTLGSTEPLEWLRLTITPGVNASPSANAFGPFNWTRVLP